MSSGNFTRYQGCPLPDGQSQDEFQSYNDGITRLDRGQAIAMTSGAAITQFAPVYLGTAGTVFGSTASVGPTIGIALQGCAAAGAQVPVLVWGIIFNAAWNWALTLASGATVPGAIYTGTSGGLTQTPTAEFLGRAVTAQDFMFFPKTR